MNKGERIIDSLTSPYARLRIWFRYKKYERHPDIPPKKKEIASLGCDGWCMSTYDIARRMGHSHEEARRSAFILSPEQAKDICPGLVPDDEEGKYKIRLTVLFLESLAELSEEDE